MIERLLDDLRNAGDNPWLIGLLAFFGASFAGLSTQLRAGAPLTPRAVLAAMLNSGIIGAIIALMGFKLFADNLPYLIGLSLLAGIGGATVLDFLLSIIKRRLGITIRIDRRKEGKDEEE